MLCNYNFVLLLIISISFSTINVKAVIFQEFPCSTGNECQCWRMKYLDHARMRCKTDNLLTFEKALETLNNRSLELTKLELNCVLKCEILKSRFLEKSTALKVFRLNLNGLQELTPSLLKGLSKLEVLNLGDNLLEWIPIDLFDSLKSLNTLDITSNELSAIPEKLFEKTPSLTTLRLQFNKLVHLPRNCFKGVESLTVLDISNNRLKLLTNTNGEMELRNLKWLNLEYNKIEAITHHAFETMGKLYNLVLHHNYIEEIPEFAFVGLSALDNLDLSYNQLKSLNNRSFEGLTSITILQLQQNKLETISQGMLSGMPKLRHLDLSNNKLKQIGDYSFISCFSLKSLNLKQNRIQNISSKAFSGLVLLKRMDLTSNSIKFLDSNFQYLTSLKRLDLAENKIEHVTISTFQKLSDLETLALTKNRLISLPNDIFSGLYKLRKVLLGGNNLKSIGKYVFRYKTKLQTLSLRNNHLETIEEGTFHDLKSLEYLDLRNNHLNLTVFQRGRIFLGETDIMERNLFDKLYFVRNLYLGGNNLTVLRNGVDIDYCGDWKVTDGYGTSYNYKKHDYHDDDYRLEPDHDEVLADYDKDYHDYDEYESNVFNYNDDENRTDYNQTYEYNYDAFDYDYETITSEPEQNAEYSESLKKCRSYIEKRDKLLERLLEEQSKIHKSHGGSFDLFDYVNEHHYGYGEATDVKYCIKTIRRATNQDELSLAIQTALNALVKPYTVDKEEVVTNNKLCFTLIISIGLGLLLALAVITFLVYRIAYYRQLFR